MASIKKILFAIILVYLCFDINNIFAQINRLVSFGEKINLKEVKLADGNIYTHIELPETNLYVDSLGYPVVPVKYIRLLIPPDGIAEDVIIHNKNMKIIKTDHLVEPVQLPVPIEFNLQNLEFVKPDTTCYYSRLLYPGKLIKIVAQGFFRGNHIVTLAVFPVQYAALKNELQYFSSIDFTLTYKQSGNLGEPIKIEKNSLTEKVLKSIVDNKEDIAKFVNIVSKDEAAVDTSDPKKENTEVKNGTKSGITVNGDYVIVTNEDLAPEFNEFMAWKRRKGIAIDLVTIEDIKANYTGDNISGINDDAGKLRQFLADAYDNGNGIDYALLAGDNTIVPIRHAYYYENTTDSLYIIPTDLYFADFDGDWKVDADTRYGEPGDDVDFEPEIYVGRIMVTNADEVHNWTNKVINYERNPGNGDNEYLTKAFFTQADQMQNYDQARYILNKMTWITDTTIFEETGGPNTSTTPDFPKGHDVINEFNKHYGFTSFMAHGGPTNVAIATPHYNKCIDIGKYKITSIDNKPTWCEVNESGNGFDNMTNTNYPSINYSISCETMPFDDFNTPANERNMGEVYTCISKGGGPAYIGNTRYGWVPYSYKLFEQFINIINDSLIYNIGVDEAISKVNYNNLYLRFSHNLIGCPETAIWTSTLFQFSNASVSENGNNIIVSSGGVNGSTICVMSALDNGSDYYVVKHNVSSWTFSNVPKPYLVTITKHNYIPYLKDPDNIYIQNQTFTTDAYIYGVNIYAGENVTSSKPQGPVIIKNGAHVVFDASNNVTLEHGFEVETGAQFEIK